MASSSLKLGREDYKKKKELEEFRKLGAAPAEVDDEGFSINPHIPQYMAEAPWYLSNGRPGLKHQRLYKDVSNVAKVGDVIQRGFQTDEDGSIIRQKKWTSGSCENCGASTHKTKECVYRPRKIKAKFSSTNIAPEERLQAEEGEKSYTYDGKRDRWNNYNIANHHLIIERHQKIEQYRRQKKSAELDQQILDESLSKKELKKLSKKAKKIKQRKKTKKSIKKQSLPNNTDGDGDDQNQTQNGDTNEKDASGDGADDDDNDDDDDDGEEAESETFTSDSDSSDTSDAEHSRSDEDMKDKGAVIQRFDSKKRQTIRNLRIREDLPKYLRNLSTKSAYYDPKTRSMRANPYQAGDVTEETYMGDNFVRHTGDAVSFEDVNSFAWQSRNIHGAKSDAIHLQSNPTMTELAFKQFNSKKTSVQDKFKNTLTERYGGQQHLLSAQPNKQQQMSLIYGQNESYREFGADGRVIKGQAELIASSKYEEDILPGNHTAVWGSFYDLKTGKWGYACCQCATYKAYCTGDDGIRAKQLNHHNNNKKKKNEQNAHDGDSDDHEHTSREESAAHPSQIGFGVMPKPKEMIDTDKMVNPSGYISTRGIMAAKGLARKAQKEQELQEKLKKAKKRAKKKKNQNKKRERGMDEGYNAEKEDSSEPAHKKAKLCEDDA
eukprot:CAMPEP_0202690598 /NCGR_PEP_ID=MMETSP1385-20130828/5541_1 /ASSEMBLY_ACC=CAM_ASM_000861 /TAXON_ID=933848 /ORGANISM="Elphidium margaritaceum" /LENGTH=661 /DNA_ID=CAMNT_0049345873 /DNA_START=19 /DNA_END=2004 /DNA_ORIENTATION=+